MLEASIKSNAECIALVCCVATTNCDVECFDWGVVVKVEVWRDGRLAMESSFFQYLTNSGLSLVQLWTLRREHLIVQSLQHGDRICICVQSYDKRCTVVEGAVCAVHREDENLVLAVNSEVLSKSQSEGLALQFGQLVLEGKDEQLIL